MTLMLKQKTLQDWVPEQGSPTPVSSLYQKAGPTWGACEESHRMLAQHRDVHRAEIKRQEKTEALFLQRGREKQLLKAAL